MGAAIHVRSITTKEKETCDHTGHCTYGQLRFVVILLQIKPSGTICLAVTGYNKFTGHD